MRYIFLPTALLLFFVTMSARAVDSGLYVGLGAADGRLNSCPLGSCTEVRENAQEAWHARLIAGYDFNRFIGIEGEYSDIGSYKIKNAAQQTIGTVKISTISLAARGGYKFRFGLSLFGKLGLASVSTQYATAPGWALTGGNSRGSTGVLVGLGAQYDFNDQLGVRLSTETTVFDDRAYHGSFIGRSLVGILRF